jgi:cytoskeletal protein RodZ
MKGTPAMASVGEILRTQRKNQGFEVTEIAAALCITSSYVCSIENDEFKNLPGIFFYKSFVKQYAAIVGVDHDVLRPCVEALVTPEEAPAPRPEDSPRGAAVPIRQRLHA